MFTSIQPAELPPFLPVSATFLLSNWFEREILEQGYQLLQQGKVIQFFFYRHGAAAFFGRHALTILFQENNRIDAGFSLQEAHCSLCDTSKKKKRCAHLAALCILSLHCSAPGEYRPCPLVFKQSVWGDLAVFLCTWLGKTKGSPQYTATEDSLSLSKTTNDGSIEVNLAQLPFEATELLDPACAQETEALFAHLQKRCTTANEQQLIKAGAISKGLKEESSLWSRLCRIAYTRLGDTMPALSYDREQGMFCLRSDETQSTISLAITLPRVHTVELLKKFKLFAGPFGQLPDGRSGSDVSLTEVGTLRIRSIVWLEDTQAVFLPDLQSKKFGPYYYLADAGFFRLAPPQDSAKITVSPTTQAAAPLFAFVQQADERVVEQKDFSQFLEQNHEQLRHPDNRVAPQILELRSIQIPDRLVLHDLQEQQGWIVLSCSFGIGKENVPPTALIRAVKKRQPLTCGATTLQTNQGPLAWLYQRFQNRPKGLDNLPRESICLTRGEFACLLATIAEIESPHNHPELQQRLARLTSAEVQPPTGPISGHREQTHLRDYQTTGLFWMHTLYALGLGGILADDMGLGKTHQAMALIDTVLDDDPDTGPILVVCPASVLLHWADKLTRFYPALPFSLYYGPNRNLENACQKRIILTTYAMARADEQPLGQEQFSLIIYDEIQALKNRSTATHQACRNLQARAVFGLSGTPIENSLADLFALFSICLPGFFGSFKNFQDSFLTPIEKYASAPQQELLIQRISPFVLRRTRSQVLIELPDLIENNRSCALSPTQERLYQDTLAAQQPLLSDIAEELTPIDYLHVFAMMTRLKQICDHPCLVENCTDPDRYASGKWDLFVDLLQESLENGRKVVVFSQYLSMLYLMEQYLKKQNIGFATLRGDMAVDKRQAAIEQFAQESQCKVFLASLLAGGTGIDLVAGNVVIHYDRWWNPAKENQATARVHRMGQKNPVDLFRLTTKNTLEEKIDAIISKKNQLSESIIKEDELSLIKELSREELLELFTLNP